MRLVERKIPQYREIEAEMRQKLYDCVEKRYCKPLGILLGPIEFQNFKAIVATCIGKEAVENGRVLEFLGFPVFPMSTPGISMYIQPSDVQNFVVGIVKEGEQKQ